MTDNLERALRERLLARSQVSPRDVDALRVFARALPARRRAWRLPALRWVVPAAAAALAIVVAVPLITRLPAFGGPPSPSPAASFPGSGPLPTPQETQGSGHVRLLTGSGAAVYVVINDPEHLVDAVAPAQGDRTMSVRWFDSIVEAGDDPGTIRMTWAGFPLDEQVQLDVSRLGDGRIQLLIAQAAPPMQSDAEGEDRELVFDFAGQVTPSDLLVAFKPAGTAAMPPLPSLLAMEFVLHGTDGIVRGAVAQGGPLLDLASGETTVVQISPTRIRVDWAATADDPIVDAAVSLGQTGRVEIEILQDPPPPGSEPAGEGRSLTLELDRIVLADEVMVTFAPLPPPTNE